MCSLFHLALGNEDGEVQLVYGSACCLVWGVFFDRGKVCVCSISSLMRVRVYVMMNAFITFNSSLVPSIEGLCSSNP